MTDQPPAWLFAYGSLIWRPDFAYRERTRGFVRGWSRRFWQGSIDHRGVPGAPGRVVTLTPDPAQACWGVAYRLDAETLQETLRATDVRERGGYERHTVEFHAAEGERAGSWAALMYVAAPHNPNYLGPASLDSIADQVRHAHGPSGANREYVLELHRILVELGIADPHVASLAALLLDGAAPAVRERSTPPPPLERSEPPPQSSTEQRAASTEPERSLAAAQS